MKNRPWATYGVVASFALIAAATLMGCSPSSSVSASSAPANSASAPSSSWPTNASGQTYGTADGKESPDLIAAVATNGLEGFVFRKDLDEATGATAAKTFKSPEEALLWQENNQGRPRAIDVFASDGTTLIGTFTIG